MEARWSVEKIGCVNGILSGRERRGINISYARPGLGGAGGGVLWKWRRRRGRRKGKLAQIASN